VIIMASLVQAEGGRLSDYPKIARVIYNRLAQRIPLQLDSTVLYGLNTYGILANDQQLKSPSPYNTYKYKGLTPGPIDNPGNAAIQAVLHPAAGNWIYFVTVNPKTGETRFTSSQAQFPAVPAGTPEEPGAGLTVPTRRAAGPRIADRAFDVAGAAHGRLRRARPRRLDLRRDRMRRGRAARPAQPPATLSGRGCRWTMPLKRAVLPLLDRTEPLAVEVGGANTVVFEGDERHGYNTDVPGMVAALAAAGVIAPSSATILGAGATACSALATLRETGLTSAVVLVRDQARAGDLLAAAAGWGWRWTCDASIPGSATATC